MTEKEKVLKEFLSSGNKILKYIAMTEEYLENWEHISRFSKDDEDFTYYKPIPIMQLKILSNVLEKDEEVENEDKERFLYMLEVLRVKIILSKDCNILKDIEKTPVNFLSNYYEMEVKALEKIGYYQTY